MSAKDFLIVGVYVFNLSEIRNAYAGQDGVLNITYLSGKEYTYGRVSFKEFAHALSEKQKEEQK